MTTDKIQLTKEKETMLMTLSGRALQSHWKNPILRDPSAEEAMRHIDNDISKHYGGSGLVEHVEGHRLYHHRHAPFWRRVTQAHAPADPARGGTWASLWTLALFISAGLAQGQTVRQ